MRKRVPYVNEALKFDFPSGCFLTVARVEFAVNVGNDEQQTRPDAFAK